MLGPGHWLARVVTTFKNVANEGGTRAVQVCQGCHMTGRLIYLAVQQSCLPVNLGLVSEQWKFLLAPYVF